METLRVMNLDLRAPLRFLPREGPSLQIAGGRECVAVYDRGDDGEFPRIPLIVAVAADADVAEDGAEAANPEPSGNSGKEGRAFEIPAGGYFFVQARVEAGEDAIALLAAELEKEALWRDVTLAPRLFIRMLQEEGGPVLQALRPVMDRSMDR